MVKNIWVDMSYLYPNEIKCVYSYYTEAALVVSDFVQSTACASVIIYTLLKFI